jgi:hypothetical protein
MDRRIRRRLCFALPLALQDVQQVMMGAVDQPRRTDTGSRRRRRGCIWRRWRRRNMPPAPCTRPVPPPCDDSRATKRKRHRQPSPAEKEKVRRQVRALSWQGTSREAACNAAQQLPYRCRRTKSSHSARKDAFTMKPLLKRCVLRVKLNFYKSGTPFDGRRWG